MNSVFKHGTWLPLYISLDIFLHGSNIAPDVFSITLRFLKPEFLLMKTWYGLRRLFGHFLQNFSLFYLYKLNES